MKVFVKLRENNRVSGLSIQNMKNPILPDDCIDATNLVLPENFSSEYYRYIFDNGSLRLENDAEIAERDFPDEDYWNKLRRDRDQLLLESDWTQALDSPLSDSKKTEWATYRQNLRDLPGTVSDPSNVSFPAKPD